MSPFEFTQVLCKGLPGVYLGLFDGLIITIGSNDDIYLSHFEMINFFFFMGGEEEEDIRLIF
jgi:hypothetical protein